MSNKNTNPEGMEKKNGKLLGIAFFAMLGAVVLIVVLTSISGKKKRTAVTDALKTDELFNSHVSSLAHSSGAPSLQQTVYNKDGVVDPNAASIASDGNPNDSNYTSQLILSQLAELKQEQETIKEQLAQKVTESSSEASSNSSSNNSTPVGYRAPYDIKNRIDPEYQSVVQHFQETNSWEMNEGKYDDLKKRSSDRIASIEKDLKELYPGSTAVSTTSSGFNVKVPAGTRLLCITEHPINSDYVGFFTATIRRPDALYGCQLIGEISAQQNNRIPTKAIAIVTKKGNRIELTENQVEMEFPGMSGQVTNHWAQRVLPGIANAALGGGAALYLLNSQTPGSSTTNAGNISTRDLIAGPILESSVQGVQNEVSRLAVDKPNTVEVQKGTQFNVLLVQGVEITL